MPQFNDLIRKPNDRIGYFDYGDNRKDYCFQCPGCGQWHVIQTPRWKFNGDQQKPTFSPSVKHSTNTKTTCHYFIRNGKIEFCSDSPHKLSGQTIELDLMENYL